MLEAKDAVYRGLKIEPTNMAMKKLSDQIDARSKILEVKSQKDKAERVRKEREQFVLETALEARKIKVKWSEKATDLDDAGIHLSPDPMSPKSMMVFPVVFLYPMHAQSDFIKAFAEKDTIVDHLSYILPLPWDVKKEYRVNSVECYMDTPSGGMIKVGKKLSLLQVLSSGKTQIVDALVRIHVVPATLAPKWIEEEKKRKGKKGK